MGQSSPHPSLIYICRLGRGARSFQTVFASHIRWCGRYIDDLLLIWEGSPQKVTTFVEYINQNYMKLRFTYEFQTSSIHFLDITLIGTTDKEITVLPYRKHTATNSMLPNFVIPRLSLKTYLLEN